MPAIIRVESLVGMDPTGVSQVACGKYIAQIKSVDEPRTWRFTNNPRKAMKFDDTLEAYNFYKTQSLRRPFRRDGNPNRPLTAFTVIIENLQG